MSAKRQATSDLNHDNWDQEDVSEERGTFPTAASDELDKRIIKKARRKITGSSEASDGTTSKSVFSGFTGFGKPSSADTPGPTASSPFSFLSKLPVATTSSTGSDASSSGTTTTTKPTFIFGGSAAAAVSSTVTNKPPAGKTILPDSTADDSNTYYAKLKGLNQTVSDWIKTHVDENPLCILTPIFKDYEKYLDEIKKDENKSSNVMRNTVDSSDDKLAPKSNTAAFGSFKFVSSSPTVSSPKKKKTTESSIFGNVPKPAETPKTNGFSFGLKSDNKTNSTACLPSTSFSFGNPTAGDSSGIDDNKPSTSTGFSGGLSSFSFGNIKPPAAMPTAPVNAEEDEEDKPKKNEFKQAVEDDAVYSKKCKVFVKKDGNFTERGVGTLYLKPVEDSQKTQLLVRADTNLGNILVNLILSVAIPTQRMGKNNVMLVCPETDKSTPMLLRVKTSEEADELLKTIEMYKK